MSSQSFQDLVVWQHGRKLVIDIYTIFAPVRDYSFKDQVQRAALAVPNNVAEGYARHSDKAFRYFLNIAKGSAAEVESMLLLATDLGYLSFEQQQELLNETSTVIKLLTVFINHL